MARSTTINLLHVLNILWWSLMMAPWVVVGLLAEPHLSTDRPFTCLFSTALVFATLSYLFFSVMGFIYVQNLKHLKQGNDLFDVIMPWGIVSVADSPHLFFDEPVASQMKKWGIAFYVYFFGSYIVPVIFAIGLWLAFMKFF